MLFRLTYAVQRLDLCSRAALSFSEVGPEKVAIEIRAPTDQERAAGHRSDNALVELLVRRQPSQKASPVFEAVLQGRRPPEGQKARSAEAMHLRDGPSYGLEYYPDPFVVFVDGIHRTLADAGTRLVKLIRWRYAQEGDVAPMRSGFLSFSADGGGTWHSLPARYSMVDVTPPSSILHVEAVETNEILKLFDSGAEEPLAHELLREAKALQFHSGRSAVLISVSAMEVAVKSVVTTKVPEAAWLLESSQSPPLVKILKEYIPQLFPEGLPYLPAKSDRLISAVESAVSLRNALAHRGARTPARASVQEKLSLAEELLWICDYLSGHGWAKQHIEAMPYKRA